MTSTAVPQITELPAAQRDKTLPQLLGEHAKENPERLFVQDADGPRLTYGEAYDRALRWARVLQDNGIGAGDRVATMLDNCVEGPVVWAASSMLGAVDVSVSTAYRGALLGHALNLSEARVAYVDAKALDGLSTAVADIKTLRTLIVRGPRSAETPALPFTVLWESDLIADAEPIEPGQPPLGHEIACVVFTSGTTGPSKGALVPWAALANGTTTLNNALTADDVLYLTSSANHLIARISMLTAAQLGAAVVVKRGFRTQDFWSDIDRYGCTYSTLVGAMAHFLLSQPEAPDDASHTLRHITISPIHPRLDDIMERFGLANVMTSFGMTECPSPLRTEWAPIEDIASCGHVPAGWPGWEVRLVDDKDYEVPVGEVGELIVRTQVPWTLAIGYLGMPEQTAQAWRNGWFHTGDAFRKDSAGSFFFVDRIKDSIRRRGENVSSFEVEAEVNAHPDVAESAAIAVPSPEGEDEIKVFVVPVAEKSLDPEDLMRFLIPRMTRYMIPRYVEVVDSLPKTPTLRVKKVELRERSSGGGWDRVAAGIELPARNREATK